MSFMLILVFLNLTTGCYYYKVNTKTKMVPEDIRWEDFNGKYLIMHYGDSAWHMNNVAGPLAFREMVMPIDLSNGMKYLNDSVSQVRIKVETGKDINKRLAGDDRKYYIQPKTGNEVILDFKYPPEQPDMKRSVILHTKGYYEHVRYYVNPPDREALQAFRQPGRMSEFSLQRFLDAKRNISMKSSPDNK